MKLVCFAVKEEAAFFRTVAQAEPEFQVLLTGMGQRNAAAAIQKALTCHQPELVLSAGFAGGLNPALATGTVVFEGEASPALRASLEKAGARPGRFHCADRVASSVQEKRQLRGATGADAVEMESGVICGVCRERGISAVTVRVILDAAEEDLPLDFNRLMTPDQRLDGGKLAGALLRSPGKVRGLLRLQRRSRAGAERLGEVLWQVLTRVNERTVEP